MKDPAFALLAVTEVQPGLQQVIDRTNGFPDSLRFVDIRPKFCRMKSIFSLMGAILVLAACQDPKPTLQSRLKLADRIEVQFNDRPEAPLSLTLTDKSTLDSLSTLFSDARRENLTCAMNSRLAFKKGDSLILEGRFSLESDCMGLSYQVTGGTESLRLDPSMANLLARLQPTLADTGLERLSWFLGRWTQAEGPGLNSYEEWKRDTGHRFLGTAWTLYYADTVHVETIELLLEGGDLFYIPTVRENKEPVRFKLTSLEGKKATFENLVQDYPQRIAYQAMGDTMLFARISGSVNGKEVSKDFPLRRVNP
ncbi:MAG: hypothetical protein RLZZ165_956 [Bacteroidota bacterium]|jgi:hypothetical protein